MRLETPVVTITEKENVIDKLTLGIKVSDPDHALADGESLKLHVTDSKLGDRAELYGEWDTDKISAGGEGIREAAAQAVLNANYLMCLLRDGGYPMAYDHPCMHEFVITLEKLKHEKDVSALDVAKALLDHGMHPPTMYFPLIVHEALMVEPTETESKESLEAAAESYLAVLAEANENPADMHNRPLTTYVRRLDEVTAARNPIVKYEAPSA